MSGGDATAALGDGSSNAPIQVRKRRTPVCVVFARPRSVVATDGAKLRDKPCEIVSRLVKILDGLAPAILARQPAEYGPGMRVSGLRLALVWGLRCRQTQVAPGPRKPVVLLCERTDRGVGIGEAEHRTLTDPEQLVGCARRTHRRDGQIHPLRALRLDQSRRQRGVCILATHQCPLSPTGSAGRQTRIPLRIGKPSAARCSVRQFWAEQLL